MRKGNRPGVYATITNADKNAIFHRGTAAGGGETPAPEPSSKTVLLTDSAGLLLKSSDGYYLAAENI